MKIKVKDPAGIFGKINEIADSIKIKTSTLLIIVILLASGLRLWELDKPELNADEMHIVWFDVVNPYLFGDILMLRDHGYAHTNPKGTVGHPPLGPMLVTVAYWLLGPSPFSARLPSAIAGIISVIAVFFIGKELYSEKHGLVAAGIFALMPSAVRFSRDAHLDSLCAANVALAALFFLYSLKIKKKEFKINIRNKPATILALWGIFTALAFSSKHTALLLIPFYLIVTYLERKKIEWTKSRDMIFTFLVAFILTFLTFNTPRGFIQPFFVPESTTGKDVISAFAPSIFTIPFLKDYLYFSPLLILAILYGIIMVILRRTESDIFLLCLFGAFYAIVLSGEWRQLPALPILAVLASRITEKKWIPIFVIIAMVPFTLDYGLRLRLLPGEGFFNVLHNYTIHQDTVRYLVNTIPDKSTIGFIAESYERFPMLLAGYRFSITDFQVGYEYTYYKPEGEKVLGDLVGCCNYFSSSSCCSQANYLVVENRFVNESGLNASQIFKEVGRFTYSDERKGPDSISYSGSNTIVILENIGIGKV